jgi:hypothetical protein
MVMLLRAGGMSAATPQYVITNDDVPGGPNSLTLFQLDIATGKLTPVNVVQTNGFGTGGGFFAIPRLAINSNCIFAANSGTTIGGFQTGDIAALTSSFSLVGNYSETTLSGLENGIGLVLNPNGKYLYAAYTTSRKIGVWQIASDCSLTLVNTYNALGQIASMAFGQQSNGLQYLVASYPYYPLRSHVDLFAISNGGANLTEEAVGKQVARGVPSDVQVTADGNVAVFGDTDDYAQLESWWVSNTPGTCTPSSAAPPCLIAHQDFPHVGHANNSSNLRLSPAAAANPTSGGCLYIANNGDYRISTETFVEGTTPGTVTIARTPGSPFTVAVGSGEVYAADIHVADSSPTGDLIVMAEYPSNILTAAVNSDCTLGTSRATPDTSFGANALSLGITAPGAR